MTIKHLTTVLPLCFKSTLIGAGSLLLSTSAIAQTVDLLEYLPQHDYQRSVASSGRVLPDEVRHAQAFKVNAQLLNHDTKTLSMKLADGTTLVIEKAQAYHSNTGTLVWQGKVANVGNKRGPTDNSLVLVKTGSGVAATLRFNNRLFKLVQEVDSLYWLQEIDESKMPSDHGPNYKEPPASKSVTTPEQAQKAATGQSSVLATLIIRVMVGYTPEAKQQNSNIDALIDLAIAETNLGYSNSGVNAQIELAHRYELNYAESGDHGTDLDRFHKPSDGYMDDAHTLRDQYGADVAVILIGDASSCGRAREIGAHQDTAFVVVKDSCATGYYSFGHELGHLMSARHNPEKDPKTDLFEYGHGFLYSSGGWRSIMSYNDSSCCTRQNFWSDPTRDHQGVPRGTTQTHDNARVLNITAPTIAAFRGDANTNIPPVASFSSNVSELTVSFVDQSTDADNAISSYQWDFGDNQFSTNASPSHTYATAGNYTVTLTVTDAAGATNSASQPVTVSWAKPRLLFTDFESGFDDWQNSTSDDWDWTRKVGKTGSSSTGPDTGSGGQGYYAYLETSDGSGAYRNGESAWLVSNNIQAEALIVTFDYHMYGSNTGRLSVDINDSGNWVNDVWFIEGQQNSSNSSNYNQASVDLASYSGNLQLRIRATAVGGYKGDIAIDNLAVFGQTVVIENRPPTFNTNPLILSEAQANSSYQSTLSTHASDPDINDTLSFSLILGPSWLSVSSNGIVSGSPASSDEGVNRFTVRVTDTQGAFSEAQLDINVTAAGVGEPVVLASLDFESGFGDWANSATASDEWLINSGSTPSSSTGPKSGANSTPGQYAYFETSKKYAHDAGDTAQLNSPMIGGRARTLSFSYHLYGSDTGALHVDIFHNGQWNESVITRSGQIQSSSSSPYNRVDVDLSAFSGDIMIRLRAVAVGGYKGDMAIDDIEVSGIN